MFEYGAVSCERFYGYKAHGRCRASADQLVSHPQPTSQSEKALREKNGSNTWESVGTYPNIGFLPDGDQVSSPMQQIQIASIATLPMASVDLAGTRARVCCNSRLNSRSL